MTLFIDVNEADNKIATSGATSLDDLDLRKTIENVATIELSPYNSMVATGRIPSLPCGGYHPQIMQHSLGLRETQFYWSAIFNVVTFLTMVTTGLPSITLSNSMVYSILTPLFSATAYFVCFLFEAFDFFVG